MRLFRSPQAALVVGIIVLASTVILRLFLEFSPSFSSTQEQPVASMEDQYLVTLEAGLQREIEIAEQALQQQNETVQGVQTEESELVVRATPTVSTEAVVTHRFEIQLGDHLAPTMVPTDTGGALGSIQQGAYTVQFLDAAYQPTTEPIELVSTIEWSLGDPLPQLTVLNDTVLVAYQDIVTPGQLTLGWFSRNGELQRTATLGAIVTEPYLLTTSDTQVAVLYRGQSATSSTVQVRRFTLDGNVISDRETTVTDNLMGATYNGEDILLASQSPTSEDTGWQLTKLLPQGEEIAVDIPLDNGQTVIGWTALSGMVVAAVETPGEMVELVAWSDNFDTRYAATTLDLSLEQLSLGSNGPLLYVTGSEGVSTVDESNAVVTRYQTVLIEYDVRVAQ